MNSLNLKKEKYTPRAILREKQMIISAAHAEEETRILLGMIAELSHFIILSSASSILRSVCTRYTI